MEAVSISRNDNWHVDFDDVKVGTVVFVEKKWGYRYSWNGSHIDLIEGEI